MRTARAGATGGRSAAASKGIAAAVMAAAALIAFTRLGATDLWAPDEPRYGQVAEELRSFEHGALGLVIPHLNGEAYTQKPPLYFWLAALAGAPGGRVSEVSARLPSALAGIAVAWLVIGFGTGLLDRRAAVLGAALLFSVFEFAYRVRRAQLDVLLTLFELLALVAFWSLDRGSRHRGRDLGLMHGAMGLAVLTKGPVGFLIPVLAITAFLAWERRLADLRRLIPPWALLLSVGPGLVWIATAVALGPSEFFREAVVTNLFGRFFAGSSHPRPFYYFFYQFPVSFLPWTLLWPFVGWFAARCVFAPEADPQRARAWRLLLAWVVVPFAFFSLSGGKRSLYLLPAFPAAALLCADSVGSLLAARARMPRPAAWGLAVLAAGFAATGLGARAIGERLGVALSPAFGPALALTALAAAAAWMLARRLPRPALAQLGAAVGGLLAAELCVLALGFPALDPEKSPRPIAVAAAALTRADEPIGLVSKHSLTGGLLYYGGRRVVPLRTPEDLSHFVSAGGRVIVVPEKDLARVTRVTPVEIRSRARSGRRTLLVVSATPAGEG